MAEYIDLNNTEVLTEAGENAKLVVEEDGELKRIPASAVGQVKTVNGVEPDETGNVDVSGLPEGVPVIQSATVGQTVVVKAVDDSGKPTEWEAVDMSAGGGTTVYQGGNGNGDDKHLYHVDIDSGEIGSIVTCEEFIQAFKTGPIYVNNTLGGMEPQIINNCWISNVYCFVEYYLGNSENSTRHYTAEYTGGIS